MTNNDRIAIVLTAGDEPSRQVFSQAKLWHTAGILEDSFWIEADKEFVLNLGQSRVIGKNLSNPDASFELLSHIADVIIDRVDIVVPWIIGNQPANLQIAKLGLQLTSMLRAGIPTPIGGKQKVFSTLLTVLPADDVSKQPRLSFDRSLYDLNLYVSPETKALPWALSAAVRADEDGFNLFALAQISSAAGIWSNEIPPVSKILEDRGFGFKQGNVVMTRFLVSAVIAKGVSTKMVTAALKSLQDPTFDLYSITDADDVSRPDRISVEQKALLDATIRDFADKIIASSNGALNFEYSAPQVTSLQDDTFMERIKEQYKFAKVAVQGFPKHIRRWIENAFAAFIDRLFPRRGRKVREPKPEIWIGFEQDLNSKIAEISALEADEVLLRAKAERLALSEVTFQPELWRNLRVLAIASIDGYEYEGKKVTVLPSVDFVAANPFASFDVPKNVVALLESGMATISATSSDDLMSELMAVTADLESEANLLKSKLVELQSPTESEVDEQPEEQGQDEYEDQDESEDQTLRASGYEYVDPDDSAQDADLESNKSESITKQKPSPAPRPRTPRAKKLSAEEVEPKPTKPASGRTRKSEK